MYNTLIFCMFLYMKYLSMHILYININICKLYNIFYLNIYYVQKYVSKTLLVLPFVGNHQTVF